MRFTLHALMTLAVTVQASAEGPKLSLPKFLRAKPASATTIDTKPSVDERLLFQPTRFPKGDWDHIPAKVSEVTFSSEDETPLHGLYTQADKPVATILFCHGNGGNVSYYGTWLAEMRFRQRVSILIFDYRGYGKSGGRPTVEGVLADAEAAREKLAELSGVSTDEIVIWGHSMGGAVAVQLAAIEKPRGLILESTLLLFPRSFPRSRSSPPAGPVVDRPERPAELGGHNLHRSLSCRDTELLTGSFLTNWKSACTQLFPARRNS